MRTIVYLPVPGGSGGLRVSRLKDVIYLPTKSP